MDTHHTVEERQKAFVALLESVVRETTHAFAESGAPQGLTGTAYETLVYETMRACAVGTIFEGAVVQTGPHAFPDIVVGGEFGVEVKMTTGDKWTSLGNSVLETTRVPGVSTVYLFFGKCGGVYEARYREYEACLSDVGVTHSPRYKIDMALAEGNSIFNKMGTSYDIFRQQAQPIDTLKTFYRSQLQTGEELWWIDSRVEDRVVSPIITSFSSLDPAIQEEYINKVLVLFPEIYGSSRVKFERAAAYLITEYNAVCSSLRDVFTAGGQVSISIDSKEVMVPRLLHTLHSRAPAVLETVRTLPSATLAYYWRTEVSSDPLESWKQLLPNEALQAFEAGLET